MMHRHDASDDDVRRAARSQTVLGPAIEVDGATIVPVNRVILGAGAGAGGGEGRARRREVADGGRRVEPVAVIVVRSGVVAILEVPTQDAAQVRDEVADLADEVRADVRAANEHEPARDRRATHTPRIAFADAWAPGSWH